MKKLRIDAVLAERGLFPSRSAAAGAVRAGEVRVGTDGPVALRPSQLVEPEAEFVLEAKQRFVSRGGIKLENALEELGIEVEGRECLDVGASTGGFTEVLLANGAAMVFSIDVGTNQLHPSLHGHPKIVSMEQTDIRSFEGKRLPQRPDVVVIDVSFISLKTVLPVALSLAAAPTQLLALIKPQFEAERKHSKRGIIRDAAVQRDVCDDIAAFAASLGCRDIEVFPSSIAGGDGNIEFFIGARRG